MIGGWSFFKGGPERGRLARYLVVLGAGWGLIVLVAGLVFALSPRTYTSGFTLILPGAGPSSTVNIDSLGQATSSAASPFVDHSLSPTENYKRLFQSYKLRGRVAELEGASLEETRAPRIELANQTKLMFVSVSATSPHAAQSLAESWHLAFHDELDSLRAEEQALRQDAYRETLSGFETAVEAARARIIAFQSEHGLISIEQFQDLVAQTESLRRDLDATGTDVAVAKSKISRLSRLLGFSPETAVDVLTLLSDASFQSLVDARAAQQTELAELGPMFGPNHPDMRSAVEAHAGLHAGLMERGRELLGLERFSRIDEVFYAASTERAGLMADFVRASSRFAGAREREADLANRLERTAARVAALAEPAAELDALMRDHQIAETVFASALARLDANRTDVFASYPLTQTVETPGLPETPATPSKTFLALGVVAALFLYTMGLALLWLRLPVIRALLKTL